jgi:hypothetical protein
VRVRVRVTGRVGVRVRVRFINKKINFSLWDV